MLKEHAIIVLIIWNVIVMLIYGLDKLKAKKGAWRIPEKTLILLAALMGGVGALAGMKLFRHKTQHKLFTIGVPLCLVLNILIICGIVYLENAK